MENCYKRPKFKILSVLIVTVSLLFSTVFVSKSKAADTVPRRLNYQGRLMDSSDNLLTGTYYLCFSIWDNPTVGAGSQVWPASTPNPTTITTSNGVFSAEIGSADTLNLDFDTYDYYLQVYVNTSSSCSAGGEALSPRQHLTSAAYSINADMLDGLDAATSGADAHILATDSSGNAQISSILGVGYDPTAISGGVAGFNGNVGIGTTTPSVPLQVVADNSVIEARSSSAAGYGLLQTINTSGNARITIVGYGTGVGGTRFGITKNDQASIYSNSASYFTIGSEDAVPLILGTNSTENMRITTDGEVGIGTTAPEEDLTVADNIQLGVSDATRTIFFDNGTVNNAGIRYESTTNMMQFSHDGSTWSDMGSGASYWTKVSTNLSPATAGDDILLNTGESLTISDMNSGSVLFAGTAGLVSQDNANLYWDNTNNYLGIGTNSPLARLHVSDGTNDLFTVSDTQINAYVPTSFNAGDVEIGYNLYFSNPTASYITSSSPLYIEAGDSFTNEDLVLRSAGGGDVIIANNATFEADNDVVIPNGNVGIGTTSPVYRLQVLDDNGSTTLSANTSYIGLYSKVTGDFNENGHNAYIYNFLYATATGTSTYGYVRGAYNYGYSESTASSGQDSLEGSYNVALFNAAGTVTNSIGVNSNVYSYANGGTITNAFAFKGQVLTFNGGLVTTGYGLHYDGSYSGISTSYGLYITGEDYNYFSGNVGIGTTTPDYGLHVAGTMALERTAPLMTYYENDSTDYWWRVGVDTGNFFFDYDIDQDGAFSPYGRYLRINGPASEVQVSEADLVIDKDIGIVGDGYNSGARNYIWGLSTAYPDRGISYYEGTPDYVSIHPGGTTSVLAVTDTGLVGIGTTGPGDELDVNGSVRVNGAATDGIKFTTDGSSSADIMLTARGGTYWMYMRNWADDAYKNLATGTIYSAGSVGIGVSSPSEKLHVSGGQIRVDQNTYIDGIADWAMFLHGLTYNGSAYVDEDTARYSSYMSMEGSAAGASIYFGMTTVTNGVSMDNEVRFRRDAAAIFESGTTTGTIDLAEYYPSDQDLVPGSIVSITDLGDNKIEKSQVQNRGSIMGIVSTNPGYILGDKEAVLEDTGEDALDKSKPAPNIGSELVALAGRVPTIVLVNGDNISKGDPITSGRILGVGEESNTPGIVVGTALEATTNWDKAHCPSVRSLDAIVWPEDDGTNIRKPCYKLPDGSYVGKIMVFVNVSWYEPQSYLDKIDSLISDYESGVLGGISGIPSFKSLTAESGIFTQLQAATFSVGGNNFTVDALGNLTSIGVIRGEKLVTNSVEAKELIATSGNDLIVNLADDKDMIVRDNDGNEVFRISNRGKLSFAAQEDEQGNVLSSSTGSAIIPAGTTELLISNDLISESSKVFITLNTVINQPVVVLHKYVAEDVSVAGETVTFTGFEVGMQELEEFDVKFDYWIVD